jgi:2-polyprenyl-6-methoxyphenol hydroxylase-like FAD-dependent oxidoreductase
MTQASPTDVTDVLVVGAGPTGLMAATVLVRQGVSCITVDAAAGPTVTSKAALVHASTLELFAEVGVIDEIVSAGVRIHRIVVRDGERILTRIALDGLPSRYPFALGLPQSTTEQVLLRRLAELRGSVRRCHRVVSIESDGDGYLVAGFDHSDPGPDGGQAVPFTIRARYVVGADGAHSAVREAVGIAFPGDTYASQFVLADVGLADAGDAEQATISLSPLGVTVIGLLPGGNHRIVATVDTEEVPACPDRTFLDALLRDRGLTARPTAEPAWSSRFRVHHRVAEHFRLHGVFLAGDAAHVHSPAAGQGMNTGIADAYDLATRLAATLAGADPTVLDGYETNRRSAALEVLRFTHRMTRIAQLRSPAARLSRRILAGTIGRLGPVQRRITMWISGLERSPLRHGLPVVPPTPILQPAQTHTQV